MTKQPARGSTARCQARYLSQADRDRCVLPAGAAGHEMAQSHRGALALPVLIHRDPDGQEWTIHGAFVRQQSQESTS